MSANQSVVVSWTAPSFDGAIAITSYTVQTYEPDGTAVTGKTCVTSGATTCTVTGLTNDTGYKFAVHATNPAGNSPESVKSAEVTPVDPVAVASAPTAVTGTPGDTTISVAWTARL